jgi:two-component system, NarL family, sensor histidine kinase UhpB
MSIRFRLIALVCVVLLVSLAFGGMIAYDNATRSVRTEMRSALLVGRQTVKSAIDRLHNAADPSRDLDDLVTSFTGNRHLRVRFLGEAAAVAAPALEISPFGGMPDWFVRLVGVAPVTEQFPIAIAGRDYGIIAIETDPHNEVLEVWNEFTDSLVSPVVFCGLTVLLIHLLIGRALRPLAGLADALEEVGGGRYRTRISGRLPLELSRLRDSFNRMAARLAEADNENRRLNEQLLSLQEQERRDLARDLHDEVSPFLFAISIDATTASHLLEEGRAIDARDNVQSITDAVRHMQHQVRSMLGRLRPIGLAEFGLREAIENMVGFWRRRRPEIRYEVVVSEECENLGELVGTTICRIVQEALSNAVRHAAPKSITASVDRDHDGRVRVAVADDGAGMEEPNRLGYGLIGIGERVKMLGGRLTLSKIPGGGFAVRAAFPCPHGLVFPSAQAAEL